MKRLDQFTREELVSLTEKDIADLIDLECMYRGKPLIIEVPTYIEEPIIPERDIEVFEILGIQFTDRNEAVEIKDIIDNSLSRVKLEYQNSMYDYKFVQKLKDNDYGKAVPINKIKVYSKEKYEDVKNILSEIKNIKQINSEKKNAYEEILEQRSPVVEIVQNAIYNSEQENYKISQAINVYKKYLELSDNDEKVAMNFFMESKFNEYKDEVIKQLS